TRFRPAGASLEPTNLTDLVTGPGAPIARPKSPTGTILFPNTPPFERLVDPNTGAPMLAGGTSCTYRTDATDTRIGPNGIAGDTDDIFPSAGDCLLWGPPGADGRQFLRSEDPIAIGHTADQTLFHTLCTLGFDEDYGVCAGDSFNTPWTFFLTTDLLSGFGALTGLAIPGIETIRLPRAGNNLMKLDDVITLGQFALADPTARDSVVFQNLAVSLIPEQQAIYGCGQLEASACHSNQQVSWVNDPVIESTIDRDLSTPGVKLSELPGGIDAMNAAGDVWTSEFAMVKATRAGTLVGTHLTAAGRQFLPGINLTRFADPNGLTGFLDRSPAEISALSEADLAALAQSRETDGWIEEFPWRLDPFWEARGVILLQADPNDPVSGPLNIFNSTGGEYCGEWFGPNPFSVGCSALETISANFERILIAQEIVGPARTFDAYETIAELQAALVGFAGGMTADPISGPDGLFAYNARIFNGEFVGRAVKDAVVVTARNPAGRELDMPAGGYSADPAIARDEARAFVLAYDPVNDCTNTALCILEVTNAMAEFGNTTDRIAAATPLSYGASDPIGNSLRINLLALELVDPLAFYGLLNDDPGHYVEVPNSVLGLGAAGTTEVQIDALNLLGSQSSSYTGLDIDGDGITDMDRDNDGIHDGADDFTPGPMGVNNPFCGSGIPGDLFQDPIQFEPAFADEAPGTAKFATAFPDGLPPRSPVFCRSLQSWMLRVGEQSPGNYGFIWHGGALPAGSDPDADGRPGDIDNCPTIANIDQADPDGDGVGSACDNCINIYNPRIALAPGSTQTTTGGQPDDDADGLGNACDVQFAARSASHTSVDASDIALFKGAINKTVDSDTCPAVADKGGSTACELYDADGNRSGYMIAINGFDIEAFKNMIGLDPTLEQCSACPLECEGDACTP
ncbi:MAG: hypothetical protein GY725_11390, partial [bacterium]|nr:hypothetical protein [bacterium]